MERACFGCVLFCEALRLPRGPSETNARRMAAQTKIVFQRLFALFFVY